MKSNTHIAGKGFVLLFLALALAGCPPKKKPLSPAEELPPVTEAPPVEAPFTGVEVGADWAPAPGSLEEVYFDRSKAELSAEARAALKKNAAVLKAVLAAGSGVKVRVEGHCDERATLEYNLALGERRANAVRNYYASLGVSKKALSSISYGEERPVCTSSDEGCWAQNRRGVTTLKSATPLRVPLEKLPR